MGFQEKMAWAMTAILIVTGVLYYSWVLHLAGELGHLPPPLLPFIIAYVVLLVVAAIIAAVAIAISNPSEAQASLDEREKIIRFKGEAWSSKAFAFLVLCALLDFSLSGNGNRLFHTVFAALMISQVAEYGFQIFFFRRGV